MPQAVAALQRVPAGVHTPLRARPPDRFAHQVMIPAHRHARGLGHGPATRPPDLISHHLGEAGAAGQRGASSGCSTAARSCLRSPAPGSQAAGPGCPPGDGHCLPSSPGTWPWPSSAPPVTPARQRRRPTLHRGRLQHCCAFLSAITPPEARPPDRFAYQVMIPAHCHARGLGHGPAARPPDLISHHLGEAGAAGQRGASSGCSTAARSCLRSPAPGGQAAGPGSPPGDGPVCRPARGHGPAAPHR